MKHVLLVDDQIDIQEMLADLLRNHGVKVSAYANGKQAEKCLKEQRYDLIVTDLQMPKVDGFTFIEKVRGKTSNNTHTPIIVITGGQTTSEDRLYQLEKDSNAQILKKPFTKQAFLDSVCAAFGIGPADIHTLIQP